MTDQEKIDSWLKENKPYQAKPNESGNPVSKASQRAKEKQELEKIKKAFTPAFTKRPWTPFNSVRYDNF